MEPQLAGHEHTTRDTNEFVLIVGSLPHPRNHIFGVAMRVLARYVLLQQWDIDVECLQCRDSLTNYVAVPLIKLRRN
jgi:hypothetical protein